MPPADRRSETPAVPAPAAPPAPARVERGPGAAAASAAYVLIAAAVTWPLVLGLGRDLPADLGDSLLNCWILGWNDHLLLRFLKGDGGALAGLWDANILTRALHARLLRAPDGRA